VPSCLSTIMVGEWAVESDSAIVSRECPVERKSNRTLTELQTIDKTCMVLLLAGRFIGGVCFVVMNCLYICVCYLLVVWTLWWWVLWDSILLCWFGLIYFKLGRAYLPFWINFVDVLLIRSVDVLLEGPSWEMIVKLLVSYSQSRNVAKTICRRKSSN
jgi:hypothetical protein